jgi:predicted dehydrogenase
MLKNENLDLLVVASPTSFHAEQASEAFSFGVDVICEKPLAGKLSEAEKIVDNMQKHQRKLMVYQPHRLFQETLTLKSIIKSGILGNIFLVKRSWNDFNRRNDWQAFQKNGGGMLNNYGSHFIDQFIYLFGGDFKSFNASTSRILTCGDAEDFVKVLAVNKNNITFDMEINMSSAFSEHEWLVYGNAGSARLNGSEWEVKYCQL